MRLRGAIPGLCALLFIEPGIVLAQTGRFYQGSSGGVGQLSDVGVVGRSNPDFNLGRLGGRYTDNTLQPFTTAPNSAYTSPTTMLPSARDFLPGYRGGSSRVQSPLSFRDRGVSPLGTMESNREQTYMTRPEMLRYLLPKAARYTGPYVNQGQRRRQQRRYSPVTALLEERNLLKPRNPISQYVLKAHQAPYMPKVEEPIGEAPVETADTSTEATPAATTPPANMNDALSERLARQYDRYFDDGMKFLKAFAQPEPSEPSRDQKINLIRAQDCFEICERLNSESARPLAVQVLVSFELRDFNRAVACLIRSLDRFNTLDELQLDVFALYGSRAEFESVLDRSLVQAADTKSASAYLLHGYFSWLNHDALTARSSLERALEGSMKDEVREDVERLRDLLEAAAAERSEPAS